MTSKNISSELNLSNDDIKKLLEEREKYKKVVDRSKKYSERKRVKDLLLVKKAVATGITVTSTEIDDYIANELRRK